MDEANGSKQQKRMSPETQDRALRDVTWLSEFLGVSKSWVYQATSSGVIPCVRIGALVRFDPLVIKAWVRGDMGKSVKLPKCR
jgi:excisionase family DNA binding protein